MRAPDLLYHYTCFDHGQAGIERSGYLKPNAHPWLAAQYGPVVWLTDVGDSALAGLATGMFPPVSLSCDRLAVCYTVLRDDVDGLVWWPDIRMRFDPSAVAALEAGALPNRWWLTRRPVRLRVFA